jgi:L-ribulose-5-phosphate 3-epimerase
MGGPGRNLIGIYEKALPGRMAWPERLRAAADAGYDFVEISIDESAERLQRLTWCAAQRAALRVAAADGGASLLSMCLSAHRKYPMGSAFAEVRQRGLDIMRRAIDFAVDTGVQIVLVPGYDVFYEHSDAGTLARYLSGLRMAVQWASEAGILLALENTDYSITSISQAMWYVRELDSPWLQVYADVGNLVAAGLDPIGELEAGTDRIAGIHVKDARPGEFRDVPLGKGMVPFVSIFRRLWETGFNGPIMLEMWGGDEAVSLERISRARKWIEERIVISRRGLPSTAAHSEEAAIS